MATQQEAISFGYGALVPLVLTESPFSVQYGKKSDAD